MELDVREILEILWRKIWVILGCTVAGAVLVFLYTFLLVDPQYTAKTTLYIYNNDNRQTVGITANDLTASQKLVDTYVLILKSDVVLQKVAKQSGLTYTVSQLNQMISASSMNGTEVLQVSVSSKVPQHAAKIANTVVSVGRDEIMRVVKAGSVEPIDVATVPQVPSSPNIPMNTVIGGLLGLVLSALAVIVLEMLDTRVKSEADLTNLFDAPIIGVVPSLVPEIERQKQQASQTVSEQQAQQSKGKPGEASV